MIDLSICIPTYNRNFHLINCLNSLKLESLNSNLNLEVCVSDNCSTESIDPIIKNYERYLKIIYNKNDKNIGVAKNIIKSVSLASGEFIWLIGNDDFVLPNSFNFLYELIKKNSDVDFYYVNSYNLDQNILKQFKHPLDPKDINLSDLKKFSNYNQSKKLKFFDLIDPNKSYEFMLSMNLCIFRRKYWNKNLNQIDQKKISETNLYSTFDNTAPHVKIWSKAFKNKTAYFISKPLTINVHGPRSEDWGNLYPFVEGVRIPQILDLYRKNGLPFLQYVWCKNFALRRFIPSLYNILKNSNNSGLKHINLWDDIIKNLFYPSIYFYGCFYFLRRILVFIKKKL